METSDSEADKKTPRGPDAVLSGTSDDDDSAPPQTPTGDCRANASTLLSLNQLKAGELMQRIHADTSELLDHIQSLLQSNFLLGGCRRSRIPGVIASHPGLIAAHTLSQYVAVNVDELVTLCHDSAADAEQKLQGVAPSRERERRTRRQRHRTDSAASYCYPQKALKRSRIRARVPVLPDDEHPAVAERTRRPLDSLQRLRVDICQTGAQERPCQAANQFRRGFAG